MAVQVDTEKFSEDDQGGASFSVTWFADTRAEALLGIPTTYEGLSLTGKQSRQWSAGKKQYLVDANYEGIISTDPGPEFDDFDLDTEQREEKIESFPNRQLLVNEFGAYLEDGKLKFPPVMPEAIAASVAAAAGAGSVLAAFSAAAGELAAGEVNPFYNVTTYPVYYTTGIHSYIRKKPKSGFDALNGQVVERLPSGFEYDGPGTKWHVRTRRSKQGNAWRHEATYRELDEFAHLEALNRLLREGRGSGSTASSVKS